MKNKDIVSAVIWRESVYKNRFVCSCGTKLSIDGRPNDNTGVNAHDSTDNRVFCLKCKQIVAVLKEVPDYADSKEGNRLLGDWNDYAEKYMSDYRKADKLVKELREQKREYKQKLSVIHELESKVQVLTNRCLNKDKEIANYKEQIKNLSKEYNELSHRLDEVIESKFSDNQGVN